jgi:hypothetical protein
VVTPYLTQHSPPAFVAMLPPMEQISYDDWVRRIPQAMLSRRRLDLRIEGTGSTTATRLATSISIDFIRSRLSTMPPETAEAPPERPLPAPRGTTGTRCSAAH